MYPEIFNLYEKYMKCVVYTIYIYLRWDADIDFVYMDIKHQDTSDVWCLMYSLN
jgi:hypothetical protein